MSTQQYWEFRRIAEEAAVLGGTVLKSWTEKFTVSEKGPADLVTEADLASQVAIYDFIHAKLPTHGFLGEEGLSHSAGSSGYRWIIDPLDGTSNYVHRFPYYAVSIGLEHNGELVVGVILDPTRDEIFSAARDCGATVNGKQLVVSKFNTLNQAMVIASFLLESVKKRVPMQRFLKVLPHAQTIHRSGSSALNLAYIAAGRLDGYWSSSLKPWDMAAGIVLVQEAGGRVTQMDGSPINHEVPNLLASNGAGVHDELTALLK